MSCISMELCLCDTSTRKTAESSCAGVSSKLSVSFHAGSRVPWRGAVFFFFVTRPFELSCRMRTYGAEGRKKGRKKGVEAIV